MNTLLNSKYFSIPVLVIGLALASLTMLIQYQLWDFDDGCIVYRIVNNILAGHGWVYNLGENINASTSALNTIIFSIT